MAAVMALEVSNGHMGPFQKQHPCPEKYPAARRSAVRNPYGPARPSGSTTVDHDPAYAVAFSLGTASKYHGDDKDASSRTPARDVDGGGGGDTDGDGDGSFASDDGGVEEEEEDDEGEGDDDDAKRDVKPWGVKDLA